MIKTLKYLTASLHRNKKSLRKHFLIPALLLATLLPTLALADYTVSFAEPPFKINHTLLGTEGWEQRLDSQDSEEAAASARFVKIRWDNHQPAARFFGTSVKVTFPETTSTRVKISMDIAFTLKDGLPELGQFRFIPKSGPFKEFVLAGGENGGLGFADGSGRNTEALIPFADLKSNSYYTITFLVNYASMTFDVEIIGKKRDDSELHFEKKDITFDGNTTSLQEIWLLSSKNIAVYLRNISIVSE